MKKLKYLEKKIESVKYFSEQMLLIVNEFFLILIFLQKE